MRQFKSGNIKEDKKKIGGFSASFPDL